MSEPVALAQPAPAAPPVVAAPAPVVAPVVAPAAPPTALTPEAPKVVAPTVAPVEVKLDLKLPENSPLDQARVEQVKAFAKEKNLSNEQAQMILERESDTLSVYKASQDKMVSEEKARWVDEIKSDPEIGGEKFAENIELASRVVNKFGTDNFKKILNETGLGNHPELVRLFNKIGKAYGEDKLIVAAQPTTVKKSAAEMLYGK